MGFARTRPLCLFMIFIILWKYRGSFPSAASGVFVKSDVSRISPWRGDWTNQTLLLLHISNLYQILAISSYNILRGSHFRAASLVFSWVLLILAENPEKKINSTYIWHLVGCNPSHNDWRRVFSPLRHPYSPGRDSNEIHCFKIGIPYSNFLSHRFGW